MTPQEWVHWLEMGAGARWIRRGALALGVILLSILVGYKQFRGPTSEHTFAQAVVGRQLAAGQGYTTLVNHPQTAAWLKERGGAIEQAAAYPELEHAPLYPAAIAAAIRTLPEKYRVDWFRRSPVPPDGFRADYVLLLLNIGFFWVAVALTYLLGSRIFDRRVGMVAAAAVMLSYALWRETVAVNGTPLPMVLLLGLFLILCRLETVIERGQRSAVWWAFAGGAAGLLVLAEYSALPLGFLMVAYAALRDRAKRVWATMATGVGFLLAVGPWFARNIRETGNPLALAWQGIAFKTGDPTADPETFRSTFATVTPPIDVFKLGNKVLTYVQKALQEDLWSGGAFLLAAFFVAGLVYRFRDAKAARLRLALVTILPTLLLGQALMDSGQSERAPLTYAAPILIIYGVAFFQLLVASSDVWASHARGATIALLVLQAAPLMREVLEPRRAHFSYPPYYPTLYHWVRDRMQPQAGVTPAWMADVPAGAAWYSGQRVWSQPARLRDFYRIGADQPMRALVLTPRTFDDLSFASLTRVESTTDRLGEWSQVYRGMITGRYPPAFPLTFPQEALDNFYVLLDPALVASPGK